MPPSLESLPSNRFVVIVKKGGKGSPFFTACCQAGIQMKALIPAQVGQRDCLPFVSLLGMEVGYHDNITPILADKPSNFAIGVSYQVLPIERSNDTFCVKG